MYFLDLMITITRAGFCAKDINCQINQAVALNVPCVQSHLCPLHNMCITPSPMLLLISSPFIHC